MMIYYTKDKRKFEYSPSSLLVGTGTQASVYKLNDNECIKIYDKDTLGIDPEIFSLFQSMNLKGYYKLGDLLYSEKMDKICAHTMAYYSKSDSNILDMPTDYTLVNFALLYDTMCILAGLGVQCRDLIPSNAIIGNNEITIIDIDMYLLSKNLTPNYLFYLNVKRLLDLFNSLYMKALGEKGFDPFIKLNNFNGFLFEFVDDLFQVDYFGTVKSLSRKMNSAKKPMELFSKYLPRD